MENLNANSTGPFDSVEDANNGLPKINDVINQINQGMLIQNSEEISQHNMRGRLSPANLQKFNEVIKDDMARNNKTVQMRRSCDTNKLYEVDDGSVSQENNPNATGSQMYGPDQFDVEIGPPPKTTLLMIDEQPEKNDNTNDDNQALPEIKTRNHQNETLGYFGGDKFLQTRSRWLNKEEYQKDTKNLLKIEEKDQTVNPKLRQTLSVRYDNRGSPINRSILGDQSMFQNLKVFRETTNDIGKLMTNFIKEQKEAVEKPPSRRKMMHRRNKTQKLRINYTNLKQKDDNIKNIIRMNNKIVHNTRTQIHQRTDLNRLNQSSVFSTIEPQTYLAVSPDEPRDKNYDLQQMDKTIPCSKLSLGRIRDDSAGSLENNDQMRIQRVFQKHDKYESKWNKTITSFQDFRYKQTIKDVQTTKKKAGIMFQIHKKPSIVKTLLEQQRTPEATFQTESIEDLNSVGNQSIIGQEANGSLFGTLNEIQLNDSYNNLPSLCKKRMDLDCFGNQCPSDFNIFLEYRKSKDQTSEVKRSINRGKLMRSMRGLTLMNTPHIVQHPQ